MGLAQSGPIGLISVEFGQIGVMSTELGRISTKLGAISLGLSPNADSARAFPRTAWNAPNEGESRQLGTASDRFGRALPILGRCRGTCCGVGVVGRCAARVWPWPDMDAQCNLGACFLGAALGIRSRRKSPTRLCHQVRRIWRPFAPDTPGFGPDVVDVGPRLPNSGRHRPALAFRCEGTPTSLREVLVAKLGAVLVQRAQCGAC